MNHYELRTGEREVWRKAIEARRAFGGGSCTLLVIGTNQRVLLLWHAATDTAADLSAEQTDELVAMLTTARPGG